MTISTFCHIGLYTVQATKRRGRGGISHCICQVHTLIFVCIAFLSHAWRLCILLLWHRVAPHVALLDAVHCGI